MFCAGGEEIPTTAGNFYMRKKQSARLCRHVAGELGSYFRSSLLERELHRIWHSDGSHAKFRISSHC
jgi:hypothetical protein